MIHSGILKFRNKRYSNNRNVFLNITYSSMNIFSLIIIFLSIKHALLIKSSIQYPDINFLIFFLKKETIIWDQIVTYFNYIFLCRYFTQFY